jgi:hypothetical protein
MEPIPSEIYNHIRDCSESYETIETSLADVYNSKILDDVIDGSGFCVKIDTKGIVHEKAGDNRVIIDFSLSDGEYSVPAIVHNADSDYLEGALSKEDLTHFLTTLTRSQKQGKRVEVKGKFVNYGKKRVFLCSSVSLDEGLKESQMTDTQFKKFKQLCNRHKTSPLDLMMRDDTLWAELFAKDFLKKAVLLFCMNPLRKQDMIHIGIVSSHGEGKDHLVENVIQKLVPCRMAGSGKMATIPGLFGAMSGDDLNAIEIGLLPKMNHERVAVSEFQTWNDETFGELMNMMANGKIEMQKGALDVQRQTTLNLMFLGNPPHYYDEDKHDKKVMLDAFGQYTFQIISRLTLIFTQLSLSGGSAIQEIRNAIISSMDGDYRNKDKAESLDYWRIFFREYLRYVSRMEPRLRDYIPRINSTYDEIEARPQFQNAFCIRTATDNRKYQEFANLVRAFARLQGDEKISWRHLCEARDIFEMSLQTLTEEFPLAAMIEGITPDIIEVYKQLVAKCPMAESVKELKSAVKMTNNQLDVLVRSGAITKFDDGKYFVNDDWIDKIEGGEQYV